VQLFDTTQTALEIAMQGTSLRQTAIAENLANVNTPGYRRRTVSFEDSLGAAMRTGDHRAVSLTAPAVTVDPSAPLRADGNSVDLDVEAAGEARNGLHYQALVMVTNARTTILQTAIGHR
jgi:flagellar basal-body rod protein FlgB